MPTVPFRPVQASVQHGIDAHAQQPVPPFAHEDPWQGLVAAALSIDVATLRRFMDAMAGLGQPLDPARLFMDTAYAYRHLAAAHAVNDDGLKALSLQLFERYQRVEHRRQRGMGRPVAH